MSIFSIQNSPYRSMAHVSQSQVKAVQWVKKGVCRDMARNGRKDNLVWDLTPTRLAPFSCPIPMSNVIFRVLLKSYSLLYLERGFFAYIFFLQFCTCLYIDILQSLLFLSFLSLYSLQKRRKKSEEGTKRLRHTEQSTMTIEART